MNDRTPIRAPNEASDRFLMFDYKIVTCPRRYSHDWISCPYAHSGESARRRDPRVYKPIPCPESKGGAPCPRGDSCKYAHNDFEYWLHPTRFKTEYCKQGPGCNRKVCFFAHHPGELRKPPSVMYTDRGPFVNPAPRRKLSRDVSNSSQESFDAVPITPGRSVRSVPSIGGGLGPGSADMGYSGRDGIKEALIMSMLNTPRGGVADNFGKNLGVLDLQNALEHLSLLSPPMTTPVDPTQNQFGMAVGPPPGMPPPPSCPDRDTVALFNYIMAGGGHTKMPSMDAAGNTILPPHSARGDSIHNNVNVSPFAEHVRLHMPVQLADSAMTPNRHSIDSGMTVSSGFGGPATPEQHHLDKRRSWTFESPNCGFPPPGMEGHGYHRQVASDFGGLQNGSMSGQDFGAAFLSSNASGGQIGAHGGGALTPRNPGNFFGGDSPIMSSGGGGGGGVASAPARGVDALARMSAAGLTTPPSARIQNLSRSQHSFSSSVAEDGDLVFGVPED